MKKFLFIIPLTFILSYIFIVPVAASTGNQAGYVILENTNTNTYIMTIYYYNFDHWANSDPQNNFSDNDYYYGDPRYQGTFNSINDAYDYFWQYLVDYPLENYNLTNSVRTDLYIPDNSYQIYIYNCPYRYTRYPDNTHDEIIPGEPDTPEPGPDWLSAMWEWFLWQLGMNDDYSGDIDAYITGGDRDPFELVTPSPTPSPTPEPTPTPYTLDIVDNNGNPVYTITGIPGATYNITNNTNNNDGSDFDIFEVDLQIGDGGSTNPRDGLNDVMDTSLTYLSDPDNVDMQPVGDSFSIIPNDWFLIIGICSCFPFIAGFISKLLK